MTPSTEHLAEPVTRPVDTRLPSAQPGMQHRYRKACEQACGNTPGRNEGDGNPLLNSGIYTGWVYHHRRQPKTHGFRYALGMLVLDLDELDTLEPVSHWFSSRHRACLRFRAGDYLTDQSRSKPSSEAACSPDTDVADVADVTEKDNPDCPRALKQRVLAKIKALGAELPCETVLFAGQLRHLGFYFSPVNFFFCYHQGKARYLLSEVSNTPWNQRHCYLVDLAALDTHGHKKGDVVDCSDKVFHVSPFMDLDMRYLWRVAPPSEQLMVGLENHNRQRMFRADMQMKRSEFNKANLSKMVRQFPLMTFRIVVGIYWQALKLFLKGIAYVPHPGGIKGAPASHKANHTPSSKTGTGH